MIRVHSNSSTITALQYCYTGALEGVWQQSKSRHSLLGYCTGFCSEVKKKKAGLLTKKKKWKKATTETDVSFSSRALTFCLLLLWAMREVKRVHISTISRAPDQRKHTRTRGYCAWARTPRGRHTCSAHQRLCTRMQKHKNCPSVSHCTTSLNPATLTFSLRVCACFTSDQHYMHTAKLKKKKSRGCFCSWDSCSFLTLPTLRLSQSVWSSCNNAEASRPKPS